MQTRFYKTSELLCKFQLSSKADIEKMVGMCAGGEEDQSARLSNMVAVVRKTMQRHQSLLLDTDQLKLADHWQKLFDAINSSKATEALNILYNIPENDLLFRAICAVHPQEYLAELVLSCIAAKKNGLLLLDNDIIITPGTFEVLIKGIATALLNPSKLRFIFGLPSHHAFTSQGSGFCILNTFAILIKYLELTRTTLLNYVIIGTDVNRDNGLCGVLSNLKSASAIQHIDVYDSRVYPYQKVDSFKTGNYEYLAFDLATDKRKKNTLHPALQFALNKLEERVKDAQKQNTKIMILMPTGWDSHEHETAYCGTWVNGKRLTKTELHQHRFSDDDLSYFYDQIFKMVHEHPNTIEGLYWGLEGGYEPKMYKSQIKLLLNCVTEFLMQEQPKTVKQFK